MDNEFCKSPEDVLGTNENPNEAALSVICEYNSTRSANINIADCLALFQADLSRAIDVDTMREIESALPELETMGKARLVRQVTASNFESVNIALDQISRVVNKCLRECRRRLDIQAEELILNPEMFISAFSIQLQNFGREFLDEYEHFSVNQQLFEKAFKDGKYTECITYITQMPFEVGLRHRKEIDSMREERINRVLESAAETEDAIDVYNFSLDMCDKGGSYYRVSSATIDWLVSTGREQTALRLILEFPDLAKRIALLEILGTSLEEQKKGSEIVAELLIKTMGYQIDFRAGLLLNLFKALGDEKLLDACIKLLSTGKAKQYKDCKHTALWAANVSLARIALDENETASLVEKKERARLKTLEDSGLCPQKTVAYEESCIRHVKVSAALKKKDTVSAKRFLKEYEAICNVEFKANREIFPTKSRYLEVLRKLKEKIASLELEANAQKVDEIISFLDEGETYQNGFDFIFMTLVENKQLDEALKLLESNESKKSPGQFVALANAFSEAGGQSDAISKVNEAETLFLKQGKYGGALNYPWEIYLARAKAGDVDLALRQFENRKVDEREHETLFRTLYLIKLAQVVPNNPKVGAAVKTNIDALKRDNIKHADKQRLYQALGI